MYEIEYSRYKPNTEKQAFNIDPCYPDDIDKSKNHLLVLYI